MERDVLDGIAVVVNQLNRPASLAVLIFDAAGLGAYAVVGADRAMAAGLSDLGAILVGLVNAVGGGVLRDVITREEPILFKPGQYYATAAVIGSVLYVGVRSLEMHPEPAAFIAGERGHPACSGAFRKAERVLRLAGHLELPVVTLVDTPGVESGAGSDAAQTTAAMAAVIGLSGLLPVPMVSVVIGEAAGAAGMSLGVGDRILMQEHAVYTVGGGERTDRRAADIRFGYAFSQAARRAANAVCGKTAVVPVSLFGDRQRISPRRSRAHDDHQ